MAKSNNAGAINALKGYEAQFLYILFRIFHPTPGEAEFVPEGKFEDLDIYGPGRSLKEIVQIKNLTDNLQLNHILGKNGTSLLRRALAVYETGDTPTVTLVSFGPVSAEVNELSSGNISPKLKKKLIDHGLSAKEIDVLGNCFQCHRLDATEIQATVFSKLKALQIYANIQEAVNFLMYSMYRAAIFQEVLTAETLTRRLFEIGKFLDNRESFHKTFGTLIRPISAYSDDQDIEHLRNDFFQGIAAKYAHILANVDVRRVVKLDLLTERFTKSNVVFIHGASGQGKSTLAYRYLHENCDINTTFEVTMPDDPVRLYAIINTLDSMAQHIETPLTLYIDVVPGTDTWADVVRHLSTKQRLRILVTIREENWNAAYVKDKFAFGDIELSLVANEAESIYHSLSNVQPDHQFTSFQEAWEAFGGPGPLLEFVHLITQGETLRSKLKEQVDHIKSDGSNFSREKIKLLKFVTLSDCFQARMDYREVGQHLALTDLRLLTERMQNEYLLRVVEGTPYITGLHPIRSAILKELLFDPDLDDLTDYAVETMLLIDSSTVTVFLRHMFKYLQVSPDRVLHHLQSKPPKNWMFCQSVLKALLWKGVSEYIERNEEPLNTIVAEYPEAWIGIVDVDISKAVDASQMMFSFLTDDQRAKAEAIHKRLTGRDLIFEYAQKWLGGLPALSLPIPSEQEVMALNYLLFWLHRLSIELSVAIADDEFVAAAERLPLSVVSSLLYGVRHNSALAPHFNKGKALFMARFRKEYQVIRLEETTESVRCTFFVKPEQMLPDATDLNPVHSRTLAIIDHMRLVYSDKEQFQTVGCGHQVSGIPNAPDDTKKNINKKILPLPPSVELNRWFINLVRYPTRPKDWTAYTTLIMKRKHAQLDGLRAQLLALCDFHKKKSWIPLTEFFGSYITTHQQILASTHRPIFPKIAADEWGLAGDRPTNKNYNANSKSEHEAAKAATDSTHRTALAHQRYERFRNCYDQYDTSIENYLNQSAHVLHHRILKASGKEPMSRDFMIPCLFNLFKAYETIEDFYSAFHSHFEKFVSTSETEALEQKEKHTLAALCVLFRHFAETGTFLKQANPLQFALDRVQETEHTFKSSVTAALKKRAKGLDIVINHEWDERNLIVTVDSRSVGTAQFVPRFVYIDVATCAKAEPMSTKNAVVRKLVSSLHVIQMVNGRILNEHWSTFTADNLLYFREDYSGMLQPIPNKYLEGRPSWTTHAKAFESINSLLAAALKTRDDLSHLTSLVEFQDTEPDEGAEDYIRPYIEDLGQRINQNLETVQQLVFQHYHSLDIEAEVTPDHSPGLPMELREQVATQERRYTKTDADSATQQTDEMLVSIFTLYAAIANKITDKKND